MSRHVRLVYPHQLFLEHLQAPTGTRAPRHTKVDAAVDRAAVWLG